MTDIFRSHAESLDSPPSHIFVVTPDDVSDLPVASRALNVAQGGTIRVTTIGGTVGTVVITAGSVFPLRVIRVWATGTTATGIIAMY